MTFHSDAIEGQKTKKSSPISVFMPAAAFIATTGLLGVIEPGLGVLMGAAASLSLSMTFVSLVQTPAQFENTTAKLDVAYAVLIGLVLMACHLIAGPGLLTTAGLFVAAMLAELVISALIAAGMASLHGMYSMPLGVALCVQNRMFGLLGRAV